ncbi:MAG: alanine--tRNA ligase [Desulfurococcales archaeon]|nr:alanine--tRNA ligase [Desulfurococcales archaeon]
MEGEASEKEYALKFFKDNGFKRYKCKVGKEYFWSLGEHETCQDAPCTEYWFDKIPSIRRLSVKEARELFLGFFERNSHTRLEPRPVVARWRDDLFLTIASIVVFQPHVTGGLVPPPANPLVISQPSIRLEDIDNVGLTIGRHLTSFEMAAHHAFNYPDKMIYWKEKTVEYAYQFFTEEMRIPRELITFKESWWEGGGNAGPSFEVAVGGLELATLVFMKYKITDKGYEEIPIKIVDTGYGVERLSWFTAKTPTAFHAIYGELLAKFRNNLAIEEPDESILWKAYKAAGRLDPENPQSIKQYFKRISKETGLSIEHIKENLDRERALYSILDHTKTIVLMLGDGIVPSNTGEGYLARLVVRRALRQLWKIKAENSLQELIEMQIDYWKNSFPRLIGSRDYILDAVAYEENKYRETLRKGISIALKIVQKSKRITIEDLIKLYESNGIPPDLIAEEAKKNNLEIDVPENFYSIVASRHESQTKLGKKSGEDKGQLPGNIIDWASQFPATKRLFHEDSYRREFYGKPIGYNGVYLILDQTAFYPIGGGQDYDTGTITTESGQYEVKGAYKTRGDVIIHVLDKPFKPANLVHGKIDWIRRYRLMRHHTATHVVLGAARRVLGKHVWQAGAEKTVEKARLDITHHKPLNQEQISEIERLANYIVDCRKKVSTFIFDRNTAEEKYGFGLYQGGVPRTPYIRVVDIDGWDTQACFGTHLQNTGEIGGIKIVNVERLADGIIRLEYVAGTRVAEKAGEYDKVLSSVGELLKSDKENLPIRVRKLIEYERMLESSLNKYRKVYVDFLTRSVIEIKSVELLVFEPLEKEQKAVQDILKQVTSSRERLVALAILNIGDSHQIFIALSGKAARTITAKEIARKLLELIPGKGGGGKTFASIRIQEQMEKRDLEEIVRNLLENAS